MSAQTTKFNMGMFVHSIVGISIMLFGRFLPPPTISVPTDQKLQTMGFLAENGHHLISITPEGMAITALFLGVVYLWTFVDSLWPSFLGVLLFGMTTHVPMNVVLNKFMGNPMVVMMFFLLMFAAILMRSNISAYIARWFMTHPAVQGRPWVFTGMILFGTYCVAIIDQISSCFLMWPALYIVFDHVGLKKGDKYVSLMIVNTMMMALLCFATDPFKGGAFYLLGNINNLVASGIIESFQPINVAFYLIFGFLVSMSSIAAILLCMRFVFRVDVSPLKRIDPEIFKQEQLPPFSLRQKIILALFFFYAAWMLLPGIVGRQSVLGIFLTTNMFGAAIVLIFLATIIRLGGKPLADLPTTNAAYPWRTFILIATAFLLGNAMTSKETHVTIFMEYFLKAHLGGFNEITLTVLIIVLALIVTNFCNSVVAGFIFTPVILALANALGFAPTPIMICFFFIVLIAAITPAASPYGAILYDNPDWISRKDVALNALISSLIIMMVVIVVGIPLAKLLF